MDQPKGIIVKYTADKMKAYVALSRNFGPVTSGMVLAELLHKGVVHGLNTDVINKLVAASLFDKYVEVAQGTPVRPGANGRIEMLLPEAEVLAAPDDSLDAIGAGAVAKPLCEFVVVGANTPLARRVPPIPGADGMDVLGNSIAVLPAKDVELRGGNGVIRAPGDPNLLLAENLGVLELGQSGLIEVRPYREISGDVDGSTGDVSFSGHMKINGTIRPGYTVNVTGSLSVAGEVEGAVIRCGGDLSIRSGVRGGESEIECGGSVYAACLENAKLTAGGNVTVAGQILRSNVTSDGTVSAGSILGGSIVAVGGISAAFVGGECRTTTVLDVGAAIGYSKERQSLRSSIETQSLLSEGHISELYSYVRDNMDATGYITDDKLPPLEAFKDNLTGSVAMCRSFEEEIERLEALMKKAADCSIIADKVYPNVLLKLGSSEQNVREVQNNVHIKPMGMSL